MTEERIQTGDLVTDDADAPIARDETEAGTERQQRLSRSSTPAASRSFASAGMGSSRGSSTIRGRP
jgi:hypothetical protein